MEQSNLHTIADGGTLSRLESGLEVIRRIKHEFLPALLEMAPTDLSAATDKRSGSKFSPKWSVEAVTNLITKKVGNAKWKLRPGERREMQCVFDELTGWVRGRQVHTIRIVCDGRYIHAYPVEDCS